MVSKNKSDCLQTKHTDKDSFNTNLKYTRLPKSSVSSYRTQCRENVGSLCSPHWPLARFGIPTTFCPFSRPALIDTNTQDHKGPSSFSTHSPSVVKEYTSSWIALLRVRLKVRQGFPHRVQTQETLQTKTRFILKVCRCSMHQPRPASKAIQSPPVLCGAQSPFQATQI